MIMYFSRFCMYSKKEVTNQDPSDALTPAQTGGNTEINYSHSGHSATWPDTAQSCFDDIKDKPKGVHKGILKVVKHYGKLTSSCHKQGSLFGPSKVLQSTFRHHGPGRRKGMYSESCHV